MRPAKPVLYDGQDAASGSGSTSRDGIYDPSGANSPRDASAQPRCALCGQSGSRLKSVDVAQCLESVAFERLETWSKCCGTCNQWSKYAISAVAELRSDSTTVRVHAAATAKGCPGWNQLRNKQKLGNIMCVCDAAQADEKKVQPIDLKLNGLRFHWT